MQNGRVQDEGVVVMYRSLKLVFVVGTLLIFTMFLSHAITQDGKIITGTKGSFSEVKLNVALPESPEKLPLYRIVDVGRDSYASKDFMKLSGSVPSEEEARRLALEFLGKRGPLPDGLTPKVVEVVKLRGVNVKTNDTLQELLVGVNLIFERVVNGYPVTGPKADRIAILVGGKGNITYYSKLWYEIERGNDTAILPAENAFEKLKRGEVLNRMKAVPKTLKISEVKLGYYVGKDQKYYIPAWLFYGEDEIGNRIVLMVDARR